MRRHLMDRRLQKASALGFWEYSVVLADPPQKQDHAERKDYEKIQFERSL